MRLYRHSLTVTLTDITKLNNFLNFALSVKIDTIDDIKFRSSKSSQFRQEATMQAVRNAKDKANIYAEAFGAKLGQIYCI
ncbi:SIMPL domain-containing protein, partial [Pseudoalteromonas luteoviolacea]|uniref:SIMPL domain-containing protein n=1 Tax=Pseudoalteromonas luteoviolacea TaxID=43657 RepID=UPI0034E09F9E